MLLLNLLTGQGNSLYYFLKLIYCSEEVKAILDTGAQKNEVSPKTAQHFGLYTGARNSPPVIAGGRTIEMLSNTILLIVDPQEVLNGKGRLAKYKSKPLAVEIEVLFPKDQTHASHFDMLVGRNGLRALGFKMTIE